MSQRKHYLGVGLAVTFAILSGFHVSWAIFGLPESVPVIPSIPGGRIGIPSVTSTLGVAGMLGLAAVVSLGAADLILTGIPKRLRTIAAGVLGSVFLLRTVGDLHLFGFFKTVRETEFAVWDTWLYTPLCLAIGVATFWLLVVGRSRPPADSRPTGDP